MVNFTSTFSVQFAVDDDHDDGGDGFDQVSDIMDFDSNAPGVPPALESTPFERSTVAIFPASKTAAAAEVASAWGRLDPHLVGEQMPFQRSTTTRQPKSLKSKAKVESIASFCAMAYLACNAKKLPTHAMLRPDYTVLSSLYWEEKHRRAVMTAATKFREPPAQPHLQAISEQVVEVHAEQVGETGTQGTLLF